MRRGSCSEVTRTARCANPSDPGQSVLRDCISWRGAHHLTARFAESRCDAVGKLIKQTGVLAGLAVS